MKGACHRLYGGRYFFVCWVLTKRYVQSDGVLREVI